MILWLLENANNLIKTLIQIDILIWLYIFWFINK